MVVLLYCAFIINCREKSTTPHSYFRKAFSQYHLHDNDETVGPCHFVTQRNIMMSSNGTSMSRLTGEGLWAVTQVLDCSGTKAMGPLFKYISSWFPNVHCTVSYNCLHTFCWNTRSRFFKALHTIHKTIHMNCKKKNTNLLQNETLHSKLNKPISKSHFCVKWQTQLFIWLDIFKHYLHASVINLKHYCLSLAEAFFKHYLHASVINLKRFCLCLAETFCSYSSTVHFIENSEETGYNTLNI